MDWTSLWISWCSRSLPPSCVRDSKITGDLKLTLLYRTTKFGRIKLRGQSYSPPPPIKCPQESAFGEKSGAASGVYRMDPVQARGIKLTADLLGMLPYMLSKLCADWIWVVQATSPKNGTSNDLWKWPKWPMKMRQQ